MTPTSGFRLPALCHRLVEADVGAIGSDDRVVQPVDLEHRRLTQGSEPRAVQDLLEVAVGHLTVGNDRAHATIST